MVCWLFETFETWPPDIGNIRQDIKMPKDKDKKEKKSSKVVETAEDIEMIDSSPKVRFGVESS